MSQDHRFRSRLRSAAASQKQRKQRRFRDNRALRLEQLEQRSLLAGIISGLEGDPGAFAEPEGEATTTVTPAVDVTSAAFKYSPPRHYQSKMGEFLSGPASGTPAVVATTYLRNHAAELGLTAADVDNLVLKNQITSPLTEATNLYFKQRYNGLEIANADVNVTVTKRGEVVTVGSTAVGGLSYPSQEQSLPVGVNAVNSLKQFGKDFGIALTTAPSVIAQPQGRSQRMVLSGGGATADNVVAELKYVATPAGLELTWNMVIPTADHGHFLDTYQGVDDGGLVIFSDWVSDATYNVYATPVGSPIDGARTRVTDPQDPVASPFGWHDANGRVGPEFFDTRGNNVFAQEDRSGLAGTVGAPNPTQLPNGGPNLDFDFPLNLSSTTTAVNTNAAVTNLFYTVNIAHDLTYRYGFDELSGNFQSLNYSQTGLGGDPVLALAQSGANTLVPINNAFMSFPPDGTQPLMVMGDWNLDTTSPLGALYSPRRDTALVPEVILHEYFHGVSNRLTGGPANSSALQNQQSTSMGEGWSDFFAMWALQRPTDTKNDAIEMYSYLNGPTPLVPGKGFRRFPFSVDMSKNPLTLGNYNTVGGVCTLPTSNCEEHNAGEIWAQVLWDLNWALIDKYGYSSDLYSGKGGNNLAMRLVMEGMRIQPVNPTFIEARNAILDADAMLNRGVNHLEIWSAFARRGFGLGADADTLNAGGAPDSSNSTSVREGFDYPFNTGHIRGTVFSDTNGNGVFDTNEPGIAGVTMFLDVDNDGIFEPLEPTTKTAANGTYDFEIFLRGDYRVGQVVPAGLQQTTPAGIGGQVVTVINGQSVTGVNFGDRNGNAVSTGVVFNDFDGGGRRDSDEPGLPGVYVYADYDGDSRMDLGEPQTTTDAEGKYTLRLDRPGTYFVRQVIPAGFVQTVPARNEGFMVTITTGSLNANFEFGDTSAEDWGDAPNSYSTLAVSNGPVHGFLPGFYLGNSVDLEADGKPSALADGDDVVSADPLNPDDEDGVQFLSTMFPGSTTNLAVTVNLKQRTTEIVNGRTNTKIVQDNSAGRLHAWVDFNRDGDFDDSEKVFSDLLLFEGTHNLTINVPRSAVPGVTFARFRYGYEHTLGPTGRASAGEVEDYQVRILTDTPDAVDDVFTVSQNVAGTPSTNTLDVLANDIASSNGELTIVSFTPSNRGATIVIAPDGKSIRYTPQPGSIGSDAFTYTVRDPVGATDTARVSVTILPSLSQPIAVDDSFDVNAGSANVELDVLANDLSGRFPPIGIVFPGSPANGTVEVDNRGTLNPSDDVLRYTPNTGFAGTDQFQYTIEDASLQQSTASVTVHVNPGDGFDDVVQYRLEVTDINNRVIQAIGVGETFKIRAYVKDLRPDDTVDDGVDRRGVGAAFFDALYPYSLVSLQGNLAFTGPYTNATSGNTSIPGLINEAGALQGSLTQPLGAGELLLYEVTATATGVGTARFVGDPADQVTGNSGSPDHDTILFEPPSNAVGTGQIKFVNTSLQIVGTGGRPIATDNTFTVPANSTDFLLNVLANDVETNNPPLRISAVGSPTSTSFTTPNGSRVSISADGKLLLYTPRSGFSGTEQFSYTAANAVNLTSAATVTVQVGAPSKDISVRLAVTNLQGQVITGPLAVGDDFQVRVYVQDVRANPPDRNRMGVFASYLDLLYDGSLVSTIGDLNTQFGFRMEFGPEFSSNGLSASNTLPNVIDELGAFQTSFGPLGPNEFLLAAVTFNADKAGTASFVSDPADLSPLHDILLFEPDDSSVPLSRVSFRTTSVTIVGNGEGEFTNPDNAYDVNADKSVSSMDALVVINDINNNGARQLAKSGAGEGEATQTFVDVDGDGYLSPRDALQVINYIHRQATAVGEGEAINDSEMNSAFDSIVVTQPLSVSSVSASAVELGAPERIPFAGSSAISVLPIASSIEVNHVDHERDLFFAALDMSRRNERNTVDLLEVQQDWWTE